MPGQQIKGYIYGCIAAVSYGVNPICAKVLYDAGHTPNTVLFYRFLFGTLLLGLLMLIEKKDFSLTRHEAGVLLLLGVIFAVSSLTYFLSFLFMSAGVAATLVFAYPVFVALLMAIFFKERLKWPSLTAIVLTMCGIALLYKGDNGKPISLFGIAVIMISALMYALYIIIVNRSHIVMSSVKLTFYAMLGCLACLTLYALLPFTDNIELLHSPLEWSMGLTLGLVPTVISLVFMAMAIHCIGSTPTAIMGALEPVTAIVLAWVIFGEMLTTRVAAGVLLILFSVMLIILDGRLRRTLAGTKIVKRGRLIVRRMVWK